MNNIELCYHQQEQVLVGICPYCLKQKLLAVAAERARRSVQEDGGGRSKAAGSIVGLPAKVCALGSLRSRLQLRLHRIRQRSYNGCDDGGSDPASQSDPSSLEDSFISIKFEDNGVALWSTSKVAKASQDQSSKLCAATTTTATEASTDYMELTKEGSWRNSSNNSVVKHAKETRVLLRWRKRIELLLQLVKWKRSKKGSGGASHVDGVGGVVKGRSKGCIRALTMRRTSKE